MPIRMNELKPLPLFSTVKKKALDDRAISWKHIPQYKIFDAGNKYILRSMVDEETEFEHVAELWRENASYLFAGPYEFVLDSGTYPEIFKKGPTFMTGNWFMLVIEYEERIVGASLLNIDTKNMAIEWAPVIISKTCYSASLCEIVYGFIGQAIEQTGVEYVFALVPAFDRSMQTMLKKLKFSIRGVIPGLILAWAGDNSYCRNSIVYMDKFYNEGNAIAVPPSDLLPEAAACYKPGI